MDEFLLKLLYQFSESIIVFGCGWLKDGNGKQIGKIRLINVVKLPPCFSEKAPETDYGLFFL